MADEPRFGKAGKVGKAPSAGPVADDSAETGSDDPIPVKRAQGRPAKGKPILVRLSEEQRRVADALGMGNTAEGVRKALDAMKNLSVQLASVAGATSLPPAPVSRREPRPTGNQGPVSAIALNSRSAAEPLPSAPAERRPATVVAMPARQSRSRSQVPDDADRHADPGSATDSTSLPPFERPLP